MKGNECAIETCDIFDFMARHVGLTVVHPGGFAATRRLADACQIDGRRKVVDIACGKGTSAVYLAERYGCEVEGIDISPDLIAEATALATRKRLNGRVTFRVGDALDLPYGDGEFDVAVSQAMLVLVADKQKAIREALRVTKEGGYLGWLELSWKQPPTEEFLEAVSSVLCAYCMQNVETYEGWEALLKGAGARQLEALAFDLDTGGMRAMLADEGLVNTARVMFRRLGSTRIRKRMNTMDRFFKEHAQYFGYGVYVGRRQRDPVAGASRVALPAMAESVPS